MKVIIIFVAITYGKVSLWLWKSLKNSGHFFSYLVAASIVTLASIALQKEIIEIFVQDYNTGISFQFCHIRQNIDTIGFCPTQYILQLQCIAFKHAKCRN